MPQVRMTRLLNESTMRAMGNPRITYISTNAKPMIRLISKSLRCRSRLMGCTSNPTIPRSRKFTISASAKIATAYHACRGLGQGLSAGVAWPEVRSFTAHLSRSLLSHTRSFLFARAPAIFHGHALRVGCRIRQRCENIVEELAQLRLELGVRKDVELIVLDALEHALGHIERRHSDR